MRIGLFGGTFNPIHYGHLRAAKEVCEGFELQTLYFIPSALPPHKDTQDVASAVDRLEMTRIAIADTPEFILSDVELKRPGLSYTIDTVKYFKKRLNTSADLFLVMGIDAFLEIDTWKSFRHLFRMIPMIIMTRPPLQAESHSMGGKKMTAFIREKISDSYRFSTGDSGYHRDGYQPVYRLNISMLDISGTKIRNRVQQGQSIRFLLPESVENYIHERGIYA
jgi:nicotinate-nucleotide adenylyltransferase